MAELEFKIDAWSAWSSSKGDYANIDDTNHQESDQTGLFVADFSEIPAMKRRRMSDLSKLAISTSLRCMQNYQRFIACDVEKIRENQLPRCVFASRHGELSRSIKIIHSMVTEKEISPTDFSMSVHNTALGLYSILAKNELPATSITAGKNSFCYGLIEACLQLKASLDQPVLMVYFDEPLPEVINKFEDERNLTLAFAMVISKVNTSLVEYDCENDRNKESYGSESYKFSRVYEAIGATAESVIENDHCVANQCELFINFMLSKKQSLVLPVSEKIESKAIKTKQYWQWIKS